MNVLGNIVLDMQRPGYAVIYAVQFDKLSRQITAAERVEGISRDLEALFMSA